MLSKNSPSASPSQVLPLLRNLRDELECQHRKLLNRVDQIIEQALWKLVREIFKEIDACKQIGQARLLRDNWEMTALSESDDLAEAIARELELSDGALLRELKRAGANGSNAVVDDDRRRCK
jgi:hypothetical protein